MENMDEDGPEEEEEEEEHNSEDDDRSLLPPHNKVSLQDQTQEIEDNIEDDVSFKTNTKAASGSEEYLTRPGQAVRMKSSGQWMEVLEDIIDMETSGAGNGNSQQRSTPRSRPLKSILKSTSYNSSISHRY
jgi:hypothetical protein